MKKLIILLFIVASFSVKAQLADTTTFLIGGASNTGWIKTTAFLPWQTNDSLTGKIEGGSLYVRAFFSSVVFTTQEAGIYANAGDQTARINYVLSKSFVKGLRVSQNTGDSVVITGTVNGQNKLLISDGSIKLGGGGTLTNIAIDAPATAKIFTTSVTAGSGFASANGQISVMWWGADNTNVNDATAAIKKAFSIAIRDAIIYFPPGEGYKTSDSVALNPLLNLKMDAAIRSTDTTKPALIIGPAGPYDSVLATHKSKSYTVWVQSSTLSTWNDTNHVGVLVRNVSYSNIYPIIVSRYTWGMKYYGNGAGVAYNNTYGGRIEDNQRGIMVSVSGIGWVNENEWWGTAFRCNSSTNTSKQRYGVWIGNTDYANNNNNFYGCSFELNSSTLAIPIYIYGGSFNSFNQIRDEQNSDTLLYVKSNMSAHLNNRENYVSTGYGGGLIVDSSGSGLNSVLPVFERTINPGSYTIVTGMDNIVEKISYYASDSTLSIVPPAYFSTSSVTPGVGGVPRAFLKTGLLKKGDYLEVGNGAALTLEDIDVSKVKSFLLFRDVLAGFEGRLRVQYFDSQFRNISDIRRVQGYNSMTYNTSFGGSWITGVDSDHWLNVKVPTEAKTMRLMLTAGTNPLRIRSYKLISLEKGSASTSSYLKSKTQTLNIAKEKPSLGSYTQGRTILNDMSLDSTIYGWVCYQAGTFGVFGGGSITGSISSGSNQLILSSGGGASAEKGYILQIGTSRLQIIGTSGDTCWLSSNAPSTLTGAAIAFAVPKLKPISADGSGGGLTPTDVANQIHDSLVAAATVAIVNGAPDLSSDTLMSTWDGNTVAKTLIAQSGITSRSDTTITLNLESGVYTPTFADYSNVSSTTLTSATYTRVGDIVGLSIRFSITATAASANTTFTITVPAGLTATSTMSGFGPVSNGTTNSTNAFCNYSDGTKIEVEYYSVVDTATEMRLFIQYSL